MVSLRFFLKIGALFAPVFTAVKSQPPAVRMVVDSIRQALDRSRDKTAASNKKIRVRAIVDRHNRTLSKQAAKIGAVAGIFPGYRY